MKTRLNMIRGKILVLSVLLLCMTTSAFADEVTEVWSRLYERATTLKHKHAIMRNIVEQDNRGYTELLIDALDELLRQSGFLAKQDQVIRNEIMIMVVKELGDFRASEAAPLLHRVVLVSNDAYLKGESIIALGNTGVKTYAQDIALILRNLTLYRGSNLREEEAVAYGCIVALDRLKDPVGYLPVFFASMAGFSRRIKDAAKNALLNMVGDPSTILLDLIKKETSLEVKLAGLHAIMSSNASKERKIEIAVEGLNQGLIHNPNSIESDTYLREIRRTAMLNLISLNSHLTDAVPLAERVLYINTDDHEKISAIEVLQLVPDPKAAQTLIRFLEFLNDRQEVGAVIRRDYRLVVATIQALGNSNNNRLGHQELLRVKYAGYPNSVIREAEKALKTKS